MTRLNFMRSLYSTVISLLLPVLFGRLWWKGRKSPLYRARWPERIGVFDSSQCRPHGICFHCVSVGETLAAVPLIKQIQQQYPEIQITITTTTPTGSARVRAAFGDSIFHVYLPFDTPGSIKRFFNKVKPRLLVIMETELWPNLLYRAKRQQCRTILANARLSARSANGYANKITTLSKGMMEDITHIAAHHRDDGVRFCQLGLNPDKLSVIGSIKFDIHIDSNLTKQAKQLKQQWAQERPILVAGSTHNGEEQQILAAFQQIKQQRPDLLLILVPRHPERFDQVEKLIEKAQLSMVKRSTGQDPDDNIDIVLGDTMGELMLFWAMSDVAFVGGSLVDRGGHNPLEPAAFSVPVVTGQHIFNFSAIYQLLQKHKGVVMVEDSDSLAQTVLDLLQDQSQRLYIGDNASMVVEQNRGAMARLFHQIQQLF